MRGECMNAEKKIKIWMIENDMRFIDVARSLGVHRSMVSNWMKGRVNSAAIEKFLRNAGVPESYLIDRSTEGGVNA